MASLLDGIFQEYTLTFSGTTTTQRVDGRLVEVQGTPVLVRCTLRPSRGPDGQRMVDQQPGVDVYRIPMKGRLLEPSTFPPTVIPGSESPLEINGRAGVFVLHPTLPEALPEVTELLGTVISGVWEAR